jgi:hypothetical protein
MNVPAGKFPLTTGNDSVEGSFHNRLKPIMLAHNEARDFFVEGIPKVKAINVFTLAWMPR